MSGLFRRWTVTAVGNEQHPHRGEQRTVLVTCWDSVDSEWHRFRVATAAAPRVGDHVTLTIAWGYELAGNWISFPLEATA